MVGVDEERQLQPIQVLTSICLFFDMKHAGVHCLQRVNRSWSGATHGEPGDQGEVEWEDAADDSGQR